MPIRRLLLVLVLAAMLAPRPAAAQVVKRVAVWGGYSWMDDLTDDTRLPVGWAAGVDVEVTRWLSAVADIGGQYKTVTVPGGEISLRTHAVMGGVRASVALGPVVPWAEIVAGISHARGDAFGSIDTVTHVAWQPGGGIDVPIDGHVAVRFEIDRRVVAPVHELRIVTAVGWVWHRQ